MTLEQLEQIFAPQLGQPQIYYMLQTATSVSVINYNMITHTLADLLPILDPLTYVPDQGTYPLFRS
jgi:hypothetical protein